MVNVSIQKWLTRFAKRKSNQEPLYPIVHLKMAI